MNEAMMWVGYITIGGLALLGGAVVFSALVDWGGK